MRQAEVDRQLLIGIVELERHTTIANLLCWAIVAVAAAVLPFSEDFILPLGFRLVIMVNSKLTFAAMRRRLAEGGDYTALLRRLLIALVLGGLAWGATLIPLLVNAQWHPARALAGGGTVIGIAMIASLLSPNRKMSFAFIGGVAAALGAAMLWIQNLSPSLIALASLGGFLAIFLAYSRATAVGQRRSAELFVENLKISKILSEALDKNKFLAERDPLTELYNRRALFDHAGRLTDYRIRHLLLLDLDHFKSINDLHGHAVGDRVLVHTGRALTAAAELLGSDKAIAARIGGEEFVLVIDSENLALVRLAAEDLRHNIALIAGEFGPLEQPLVTTVSIGIAEWLPHQDLGQAMNCADAALYSAKQAGRDRVVVAGEDPVSGISLPPRFRAARH